MTPVQPDEPLPPLDQLILKALLHLEELGYSEGTRQHYALVWRTLLDFARDVRSSPRLTQQLATKFLKSRGIPAQLAQGRPLRSTQRTVRRGLRILLELQATGKFRRQPKRVPDPSLPSALRRVLDRYEEFCRGHLHLRPATLCARRRNLTQFLDFLGSEGITSPGRLQSSSLSAYITARARAIQPRSLATQVSDIRSFLRFLCMQGLVAPDLLAYAQTLRFMREHRLPPVWPPEAIEALLAAVDRSSLVGKRNYAILLLACRLGLRASDIRSLCLDDLSWTESRITITQRKTGKLLSLPLDEEIGEALIDYLEHARPAVGHREVFLKVRAPFEPLAPGNSLHSMVDSILRRAQIDLPPGRPRGLHALRHTLATRLVEAGEPLETVAGILGHTSIQTTRIYTHLDVESLRSVALDPEEVLRG